MRRRHTLSFSARAAKPLTLHGPLPAIAGHVFGVAVNFAITETAMSPLE